MNIFLLKVVTFLLILLAVDRLFIVFRINETNLFVDIAKQKLEKISDKINNSYSPNLLIVGSSHPQFGVSPEILMKKLKGRPLNLAYGGGANIGVQLALLRKLLEEKKLKPNLIIWGVDVFSLNFEPKYSDQFQPFLFNESENISEIWKSKMFYPYIKLYSRFIPRYLNQIKSKGYTLPYFDKKGSYDLSMFNKFEKFEISDAGWVQGYGILNKKFIRYSEVSFNPSKKAKYDLEEYVNICKTNNIRLIFVQIPEHNVCLKWKKKYEDYDQFMNQFVEKNNLTYWNFNNSNDFPNSTDSLFFDSDHLNKAGAELFSLQLANKLKSEGL